MVARDFSSVNYDHSHSVEPQKITDARGDANLLAFGRHFIANPDLPLCSQRGLPLNSYDRSTFYTFDARGYTDCSFYPKNGR